MAIKVKRGGITARTWTPVNHPVTLNHSQGDSVSIRFMMDSKGGGVTEVLVEVDRESFGAFVQHMMAADRNAALKAFGHALQQGTA